MSEGQRQSVLRRKAEAGRTSVAASRQITPSKALASALIHMADSRLGLAASVPTATGRMSTLAELLDTLPEGGLLAVLEGPGEAQGIAVLDAPFLSAVIEKMMTGRLVARAAAPRRPTRTDAALTADLIDDLLRRFEEPFLGHSPARWAAGFGYASYLDDPRPLGLLLEDIDYRTFTLQIDLENGARECRLLLALPAEGRGPIGASRSSSEALAGDPPHSAVDGEWDAGNHPEPDLSWGEALESGVMAGRVTLTAVLHRFDLPIASLETLRPGLELPIPAVALDECAVVGADGSTLVSGRLGQSRAARALRLAGSPPHADTGQGSVPYPNAVPSQEPGAPAQPSDAHADLLVANPAPTLPNLPEIPSIAGSEESDDAAGALVPASGLPEIPELDLGAAPALPHDDVPLPHDLQGLPDLP